MAPKFQVKALHNISDIIFKFEKLTFSFSVVFNDKAQQLLIKKWKSCCMCVCCQLCSISRIDTSILNMNLEVVFFKGKQ